MTQQGLVQPAPTPGLPDRAKAFLVGTGVAALAVSVPAILRGGGTQGWGTFLLLAAAASLAQFFAFHTIRNQVFHTTPLFFVAGAMLLRPQLLVLLPLISHIPDWVRKRYAWYIQTFNILNFTLAVMCAWGTARLVHDALGGRSGAWAAAAAAAGAVYLILNNTGFAVVLHLARGHSPREILNPQTVAADAALACLGIALAHFWRADAWLVPFAIAPIFLMHAALRLPQLEEEARVDAKTGLANARQFTDALTEELTRARRFSRPLSVIVADLDLLRNINNTYGHLAGDAVLSGIAGVLRSHVRQYDVAARFGGEEFAVVLPETSCREAREIAERIREAVATTPFWAESARRHVSATLSIGIACFPAHGTDPEQLLHHADLAAYRAKLEGRNRVVRAGRAAVVGAVPDPASAAPESAPIAPEPPAPAAANGGNGRTAAHSGGARAPRRPTPLAYAVGAAGIAAGAVAAFLGGSGDVRGLAAIAALAALGQALARDLNPGSISVGVVAALAGAATFGLRAPLLVAAATVAGDLVARRSSPAKALLTLGARSLSLILAVAIFAIATLWSGVVAAAVTVALGPVAAVAALALAGGILSVWVALRGRETWWRASRDRFAWLVPHYAVYGFVAAVAAVAYRGAGFYAFAAFAVALLAIWKTQDVVMSHARRSNHDLRRAAEMIQTQNESLERVNRLLRQRSTSAMASLSGIVDKRDAYTAGHSRRVRDVAVAIGRQLELSDAELAVLAQAALFHDIGKVVVPDSILLKPGALSAEEWTVMRRHSDEGARIIERLGFLRDAVPGIRYHHERVDGEGYPGGLGGDEIPLAARIIHVADAFDSMRTDRIYRAARSEEEAVAEIRRLAGRQFCPLCADALVKALAEAGVGAETVQRDRVTAS